MSDLLAWIQANKKALQVPLFETDDKGLVQIKFRGKTNNPILKRHPQMEEAVIQLVLNNIDNPYWEGLLYIMICNHGSVLIPLYVGKAEKKGVKNEISANITNIAKNKGKFARWGDACYYHIGDLSQAVFDVPLKPKPKNKYKRWAEILFSGVKQSNNEAINKVIHLPKLRYPVSLVLIPWYEDDCGPSTLPCSLPAVEKEVIALAYDSFPQYLLNVDGI